ncbi:MAG: dephospho-CoA kinase [Halobacteriota archaeon]|nr:dephospho-CoA kinase [Halobacteriota archaeon]
MINVGLTGGIATGKSLVSKFFKELGAYIIDYDQVSREIVEPDQNAWKRIVEYFGDDILKSDRSIDREKLGKIVFDDPEKRKELEAITHPEIFIEVRRRVSDIKKADSDALIIQDIPLLFEAKLEKTVDKIIVVRTSAAIQKKRLMDRDGFSESDAEKRLKAQMPLDEKVKLADFVISNDDTVSETKKAVKDLFLALKS